MSAVTSDNIIAMMERLYGEEIADPDIFPRIFTHQLKVAKMRVEQEVIVSEPSSDEQ